MKNTVVTLGTFDGFHIGHYAVIQKLLEISKVKNLRSVIIVIEKPLNKIDGLLTTAYEKLQILSSYPVDEIVLVKMNKSIINMSADDFLKNIIYKKLRAKHIVVGYDCCFGNNRQGNIKWLKNKVKEYNIGLDIIKPVKVNNKIVSSTIIRKLILKNNIQLVNLMLGRNFEITGRHILGNKIGRTIQFPTINVSVNKDKILPQGVFICSLINDKNEIFKGVLNIGTNPTIKSIKHKLSIEVHLLDYNRQWNCKNVRVVLHKFLRNEKQFNNLNELKNNITKDVVKAKQFFKRIKQ